MYYSGEHIQQDLRTAIDWLQKSAKKNFPLAQFQLGQYYLNSDSLPSEDIDYNLSYSWFKKAAAHGLPEAHYTLSLFYAQGLGREKNIKKQIFHLQKAAKQNHIQSLCLLGIMYYTGDSVNQDYKTSMYWFKKAADQDIPDAQFMLGLLYDKIDNQQNAVFWYKKSAQNHNPQAQYNLSYYYQHGLSVEKDKKKSDYWLSKAQEQMKKISDQSTKLQQEHIHLACSSVK